MSHSLLWRLRAVLVTSVILLGCGSDVVVPVLDEYSGMEGDVAMASPAPMALDMESGMGKSASGGASIEQPFNTTQPDAASSAPAVIAPAMVIRNGSATVEVDSLEPAIASLQAMATALGGYVGNTQLFAGARQTRQATLELKIPAARFDEALAGLAPLGRVESVNSTAQDVGEEFMDVSARVANSQRLEDRLVSLLATRTGKLEDVLAVERELARVREEIERYTGRLRYLSSRVSVSTLTVVVREPGPLITGPGTDNVMVAAFKDAWRNFVRFVAAAIAISGIVIPAIVLLLLAVVGGRRFIRRPPAP